LAHFPYLPSFFIDCCFSAGDFALTLIYLVKSRAAVVRRAATRKPSRFSTHAFLGEKIKINLHAKCWLPRGLNCETLPVAPGPNSFQSVIHLGPRGCEF
jgi:hypothetical protein